MDEAGSNGFTLVELLLVILILAIVLSVATPYFSGALFQMKVERKAQEVFMALNYSQQQALNRHETFGLFFDLTEGHHMITCYRNIGYDEDTSEPHIDSNNVLLNPLTKKPYLIEVNKDGEAADIRIAKADFGGNYWVDFDPFGEPNQPGEVVLKGADIVCTITVSPIGRLTLE